MVDPFYVLWGVIVATTLLDFYLRWRFNTSYLRYSLPLFMRKININTAITELASNKIYAYESTKYVLVSEARQLWLQCVFKESRSTLGLLKMYQLSADGDTITRDQTRLSIGVCMILVLIIPLLYLQSRRFPTSHSGLSIIDFFPVIFGAVVLINFFIAFRRLDKESAATIARLTKLN